MAKLAFKWLLSHFDGSVGLQDRSTVQARVAIKLYDSVEAFTTRERSKHLILVELVLQLIACGTTIQTSDTILCHAEPESERRIETCHDGSAAPVFTAMSHHEELLLPGWVSGEAFVLILYEDSEAVVAVLAKAWDRVKFLHLYDCLRL